MLRRIGLPLLAVPIVLVGAAFLIVAFYRWLDSMFPNTLAAAILGGAMVVIAGMLLVLAFSGREEKLAPKDVTLALLSLASRAMRSHPEKALLAAILAGALEEWLDRPPKKTVPK